MDLMWLERTRGRLFGNPPFCWAFATPFFLGGFGKFLCHLWVVGPLCVFRVSDDVLL